MTTILLKDSGRSTFQSQFFVHLFCCRVIPTWFGFPRALVQVENPITQGGLAIDNDNLHSVLRRIRADRPKGLLTVSSHNLQCFSVSLGIL